MGVFSALFGRFRPKMKLYFGLGGSSPGWNRDVYEQETVRAIIDCIASHAAKAEALHVVMDHNGRVKKIKRDSPYAKLLNQRPNNLMSGYDLKYKLVAQLEDKTTALAYIKWEGTTPVAILPISYQQFTFGEIAGGGYAVLFTDDTDGREYTLNVEDVVILRKFYNRRTLAGDGNQPIYNTLAMVKASDEGLTEALTVANKVRGLLRQKKAMLAKDDVQRSTDDFVERFARAAKEGGIVGVDSMEDFTPLNVTPWSANAAQMREIRANLFYFWRMNESILTQMSQAFTNACFTKREQELGNRILFNASALIYASTAEKVQLVNATKEIGLMTINEQRELFGWPPVEDGDERILSLNYIKNSDMSQYQTGQVPTEGGEEDEQSEQTD